MGNTHNISQDHKNQKQSTHSQRDGQTYTSQFSLTNFVGNLSGRSFLSVTSNQSVYSASRPWSRVSRRRWNESTLTNPLEASKTAWPVAHIESLFLPEFPVSTELAQKDFKILHTIAKGAFGEVYKVKKLSAGQDYALKVLSKSQVVGENAVSQVKEEVKIQEVCGHHKFIVGAVSKWQTKKRLYILSEYIPGGELLDLLEKYKKLPEELVKIYIAEIALAIDFLHNAGVVYRDLKPENILVDAGGHLQLVDFGLSKWLSYGARTTTLCGTLKYMAPEVLSREPYGHAVDWWSLGVVACRMLTGQFPTPAVERRSEDGQGSGRPGALPAAAVELSAAARTLLQHLLEVEPRRRLHTLRQLQQTAFYMKFNFDDVKSMKVSPKVVLEKYFPDGPPLEDDHEASLRATSQQLFADFDQKTTIV